MPDSGEGALDRIACTDVLPVLGWEVVEGEQRVSVLARQSAALSYFTPGTWQGSDRRLGIVAPLGHPDFSEIRLGSGLNRLR